MALVWASQSLVLEGYAYFKERAHLFAKTNYVKKPIYALTGVSIICDESEVKSVIEEKIKEKVAQSEGWGEKFEGWSSYRKYCKPDEMYEYPEGKEFELKIEYIRDWKMQKVIDRLEAKQFAILCKELGISGGEAVARI